jgi:Glycosyl hydrolase catalytic core/Secretion system C-terminal sorting domain/F5/8 type C domain
MNRTLHFRLALFLLFGISANAQTTVWTGVSNNDFFNEANWKDSVTNVVPAANTINPGVAINLPLQINNVATTITASGGINLGTGSLSIGNANLMAASFTAAGGNVAVNEGAYIELTDTTPFKSTTPKVQINFTSGLSWIKTTNYSAFLVLLSNMSQIKVNGSTSVYKTNLRLDNYYLKGCVIRPNLAATAPLTVYDGINLAGTSALIPVNTIHSAGAIPGSMDNKIESFLLKKGFMVTIAAEADGTGKSKNYIASESDLIINELPHTLLNMISFIRVMPWNWVTKKGRNDTGTDLNTSWRYQWNPDEESTTNWEFAPMAWGHGDAQNEDVPVFAARYNTPYIMSFNEPDDCFAQSGQYGTPKLCVVDEAVRLHKNLMKTGMRILSPAGREEAPSGWLKEFYNKATEQDVRIDVIGVHWYDWVSNPVANPNPTALEVFNRFKGYLTNVHDLFGLPIWITEFNANPARSQEINAGFLALALPYLESLDYIERYCWFPYNTGTHFYGWNDAANPKSNTTISLVGTAYRNHVSTPSIPEVTVDDDNNLNLLNFPNIALNKLGTASSSISPNFPPNALDGNTSTPTQWWCSVSSANLPAWFEVDLQGSFTIDSFRIIETARTVKDFNFQVWDAALNSGAGGWANALTVTGNPQTPLTTYKTITPVTTTKVRLFITAHNVATNMRLSELEIYGYPEATLGVPKYEKQAFTIYPNPATEGILNISGEQEVQSVDVYDILGAKMNVRLENSQVQVSNLASGVYFLRVNNKYSFKFIKK